MKLYYLKVIAVFLSGVTSGITPTALAADDVEKAAEALAKIYKLDASINSYLFGSFTASDAQDKTTLKYTNNGKKSGSSGFNIKGLNSLHYKIDQNQILSLKDNGLNYVFTIKF